MDYVSFQNIQDTKYSLVLYTFPTVIADAATVLIFITFTY